MKITAFPFRLARLRPCCGWAIAAAVISLRAAEPQYERPTAALTSSSGQFMVHDARAKKPPASLSESDKKKVVQLSPGVLAISAERIRESLLRELRLSDRNGEVIHLVLYSPEGAPPNVTLVSTSYSDVWRYKLAVPEQLQPASLVRGVVQVLLLEMANRGSGRRSADVPLWLTVGLEAELEAAVAPELVVSSVPPGYMRRVVRRVSGANRLRDSLEWLRASPPLSFHDLSLPAPALLQGENAKIYQCSAQLFVNQLLEPKNGPQSLHRMLRELPNSWNWQIAFLRGFHEQFQSMLDVEKWWSVIFIAYTGRDSHQRLTREGSLERLQEILRATVQVPTVTNRLPSRIEVTIPEIVAQWDYNHQQSLFQEKLVQLALLRVNSPMEVVPLIDRYRQALAFYVTKRSEILYSPNAKRQIVGYNRILGSEFLRQWTILEKERDTMSRNQASGGSSNSTVAVGNRGRDSAQATRH